MTIPSASRFTLRPFGEGDPEEDARLLHELSNYQAPQDPEENREWQRNRLNYDETRGARRHYIAHHADTREPVAYAAIKRQGPDPAGFRLYLVFDLRRWSSTDLGAKTLALVEYADDLPFLGFLRSHGFEQKGEATYNGFSKIRMESGVPRD